MIDFAKARRAMVDSQLRPVDVTDRQFNLAFLTVVSAAPKNPPGLAPPNSTNPAPSPS